MRQGAAAQGGSIDFALVEQVVNDARGVAVPVSRPGISYDGFVAAARQVQNALPAGANWDGRDGEEPATAAKSGRDGEGGGGEGGN
jgi:hypothetical protein